MCGIVGWVERTGTVESILFNTMRDTLAHRGPDGAGSHFSADGRVAIGHRRLAFIDLSDAGLQPMGLVEHDLWVTLNGEIYNYRELRSELQKLGYVFKTQTDTEVLLHGHLQWGMDGLLKRLKGMFAFALFDGNNERLHLVRDRFGIKPLYYYFSEDRIIFASELKAIMASGTVPKEVDMQGFADYFVYRYVPSPGTIWRSVSKLPPAHRLELDLTAWRTSVQEYWNLKFGCQCTDPDHLAAEIGQMFSSAVHEHARSDVEIGSFLSGGYDSSAIVLEMAALQLKVKAFSIGFKDWENSEDEYARLVADQMGAELHAVKAGPELFDLLPQMADVYDEPIADISILPTFLVSQLAASQVKAVMSGEGADELFGGYGWQKEYYSRWHPVNWSERLRLLRKDRASSAVNDYAGFMAMGLFDADELRRMLTEEHQCCIRDDVNWFYRKHLNRDLSPLRSVQQMDIKCFMGELVLTKIDRASMANSLEVRVPFLDHELFEKVFQYTEEICFKADETKFLLRENIKHRLPKEIIDRSKQGFVGPDSFYMDIDRYRELLLNGNLVTAGIVQSAYVSRLIDNADHWRLWKLAVMENWWRRWMDDKQLHS
jgi:asparagine synthase (glutamine-hydrolysing)